MFSLCTRMRESFSTQRTFIWFINIFDVLWMRSFFMWYFNTRSELSTLLHLGQLTLPPCVVLFCSYSLLRWKNPKSQMTQLYGVFPVFASTRTLAPLRLQSSVYFTCFTVQQWSSWILMFYHWYLNPLSINDCRFRYGAHCSLYTLL